LFIAGNYFKYLSDIGISCRACCVRI